jgi:hypothetical protein
MYVKCPDHFRTELCTLYISLINIISPQMIANLEFTFPWHSLDGYLGQGLPSAIYMVKLAIFAFEIPSFERSICRGNFLVVLEYLVAWHG